MSKKPTGRGSQLWLGVSLRGLQSSRVDGLVERRVEGLVVGPGRCARQDLRGWSNSGRSCAGSFARTVELLALVCWSDGPLRRRDVVCRRAILRRGSLRCWTGAPVGQEGRDRALWQEPMAEAGRSLGANRPSLGQPLARSAGREPWLAGYAEAWTGGSLWERRIRVRACRQQGVLDGSQGQPGLARGLEVNRGGARRRGPGRGPLNPIWVGVGRHDRRSWRGLKIWRSRVRLELVGSLARRDGQSVVAFAS